MMAGVGLDQFCGMEVVASTVKGMACQHFRRRIEAGTDAHCRVIKYIHQEVFQEYL